MKASKVLKKNPNVVTRNIDKDIILVPIIKRSDEMNCFYTLNRAASAVWDMIDGKNTVGDIKKKVLEKFNTTSEAATEKLQKLIKELKETRIVL